MFGFSVIVPAWNEETLLPELLARIRRTPGVGEVIVADADSVDGTADVAIAHGCRVVRGGRPARGRNAGARIARSGVLVFVDADVVIPAGVFDEVAAAFADPAVNAVHTRLVPLTGGGLVRACYAVLDRYFLVCNRLRLNQALGAFIAVRRTAYDAVGGFDERISAGEDTYFFRQVGRLPGAVVYRRDIVVAVSARRFEAESPTLFILKNLVWATLRLLGLRSSIIPYAWPGHER